MSSPIGRLDFTAETAEGAERKKGAKLNRWSGQIIGAAMRVPGFASHFNFSALSAVSAVNPSGRLKTTIATLGIRS